MAWAVAEEAHPFDWPLPKSLFPWVYPLRSARVLVRRQGLEQAVAKHYFSWPWQQNFSLLVGSVLPLVVAVVEVVAAAAVPMPWLQLLVLEPE